MKVLKNLWMVGAFALMTGVFAACGGSGGNDESKEAISSLPTDGVLGDLPKMVAESEATIAEGIDRYWKWHKEGTASEHEAEIQADQAKQGELMHAMKDKKAAMAKELAGKEIPTEVADSVPLNITTPFTFNGTDLEANAEGEFTKDVNTPDYFAYKAIAVDKDNKIISIGKSIDVMNMANAKVGTTFTCRFYFKVDEDNAEEYAYFNKIVIMDTNSISYKQAVDEMNKAKEEKKKAKEAKENEEDSEEE